MSSGPLQHRHGHPTRRRRHRQFRKAILLDIGLFHALADTPAGDRFPTWRDLAPTVRGQLAEQLVGQSLLLGGAPTGDGPRLFYWQREGGRPGEIDFLIQAESRIVPIELKSGASGALKSLHQFMFDKKLRLAVRVDENPPSLATIDIAPRRAIRSATASWACRSISHGARWRPPRASRAEDVAR